MIDLTHIPRRAFDDVISLSTRPVIVSHGGCQGVNRRSAQGRGTDDQEHLLWSEQHDAQDTTKAAGSPSHPVHPDPLASAPAVRARSSDRDFQDVSPDVPLHPGQVRPPADQLAIGRGPVRAAPTKQRDRFEQARLAGRIGSPDEMRPGPERRLQRHVPAQVLCRDGVQQSSALRFGYEVVRTGITT